MLIGCSGWIYPDWEGQFYTKGEKDKLLFYSSLFSTVEVNATFYRPIGENTLKSWIRGVASREFKFTFKAPSSITHEKLALASNAAASEMHEFQQSHLKHFIDAGMMGALLIQLPPYFALSQTPELLQVISSVDVDRVRVFVEPRHRKLYENPDFNDSITGAGAGIVSIDSPEISLHDNPPADRKGPAYVRLHGRNTEMWWKKNAGKTEKYDYEYSEKELSELSKPIMDKARLGDEIFVYFNNHPSGKAPRNARLMMSIIGLGT